MNNKWKKYMKKKNKFIYIGGKVLCSEWKHSLNSRKSTFSIESTMHRKNGHWYKIWSANSVNNTTFCIIERNLSKLFAFTILERLNFDLLKNINSYDFHPNLTSILTFIGTLIQRNSIQFKIHKNFSPEEFDSVKDLQIIRITFSESENPLEL